MAMAGSYTSALADLRDTVKWIAAAFTGAGAIVFSGLAVTNIAKLTEAGHWIGPVALAAVPLLASAFGIAAALRVIKVTPPPTVKLFPGYWKKLTGEGSDPLPEPISLGNNLPTAVAVYGSLTKFDERLMLALASVRRTEQAAKQNASRQPEYAAALATLDGLQATVQDALDCAAYVTAKAKYRIAIYQIYAAAAVAVAGLLVSGVTTGYLVRSQHAAAASAAPVPVSFRVPTGVSVFFVGAVPARAQGPHRCPLWSGVPATAVGGTFRDPLLLFSGYSKTVARRHGVTGVAARCSQPWLWAAKPGQVLLVPR